MEWFDDVLFVVLLLNVAFCKVNIPLSSVFGLLL